MLLEITTETAISYTILIMIVFFVFPFAITLKYYTVQKRKFNYVFLKEILNNHKDKITDPKDLKFLEESLPKVEKYYKSWWLNLGPIYARKQNKIEKIARKYQIVVFDFYK